MSEITDGEVHLPRSIKQLRSSAAVKAYQKEWFHKIREGEYGICNADEAEEIFTAFGMPVVVVQWWMAIIAAKRMSSYYGNILAKRGYDMGHYAGSLGLAVTIDNNPDTAPWGGLPKPAIMLGSSTLMEIWAREYGCPCFPLEGGYRSGGLPFQVPPRWWERIRDHWDEMIDPRTLDFRVEQYKELIKFLEITTG
ncbi:2-hydroxyacyl-CoA dehydratase, partial [Chloroflexota bacterium]